MKVGIMQPYFFPYIGYWQLMNVVDKYVVFDDVNYINRGWINRNRILEHGEVRYFNLPCIGCSQNKLINEINVNNDKKEIRKKLRQIEMAYSKAPYFKEVYSLVESIMMSNIDNLAKYLMNSFDLMKKYFGIKTELIMSSDIKKNNELKGQDKIIHICKSLNATEYYNAIGGKELYDYSSFEEMGIKLMFLRADDIVYKQFNNSFQSSLSIIDMMMFCSVDEIQKYLNMYTIE